MVGRRGPSENGEPKTKVPERVGGETARRDAGVAPDDEVDGTAFSTARTPEGRGVAQNNAEGGGALKPRQLGGSVALSP